MRRAFAFLAIAALCASCAETVEPALAVNHLDPGEFARLDALVRDTMRGYGTPGVSIAIVRDGELAFAAGWGRADERRRMSAATPVVIGSLSKSLTAHAALDLVESGALDLDSPVRRYLPGFALAPSADDPDPAASITVRHLLNQTSGIPTAAGLAAFAMGDSDDGAVARRVADLARVAPSAKAGARFEYSNANYSVLGAVIAASYGKGFESALVELALDPLGMRGSGACQPDRTVFGRGLVAAGGYRRYFGLVAAEEIPFHRGDVPAGFIAASAADMGAFLSDHLPPGAGREGRRALPPAAYALLHEPPADLPDSRYAMGWIKGARQGRPVYFHDGGTPTSQAHMLLDPERGVAVFVGANLASFLEAVSVGGITATLADATLTLVEGDIPQAASYVPVVAVSDAIYLALAAAMALSIAAAFKRARAISKEGFAGAGRAARFIARISLTCLAWPPVLIALGPLVGFGSWSVMDAVQPDLTRFLFLLCAASLIKGIALILVVARAAARRGASAASRP
jgi:CubicO group peptidase (beta-lactamase class C family)